MKDDFKTLNYASDARENYKRHPSNSIGIRHSKD